MSVFVIRVGISNGDRSSSPIAIAEGVGDEKVGCVVARQGECDDKELRARFEAVMRDILRRGVQGASDALLSTEQTSPVADTVLGVTALGLCVWSAEENVKSSEDRGLL